MTAINVVVLPDRIHIVSDLLCVNTATGRIEALRSKVQCGPWGVVGFRGRSIMTNVFVEMATSGADDFASLYARIGENIRTHFTRHKDDLEKKFGLRGAEADIIVAGFDRATPRAAFVATHQRHKNISMLRRADINGVFLAPYDASLSEHAKALREDFTEKRAVALVKKQRTIPEGMNVVGGGVQLTTIFRDKVETKMLKRWSGDRIGETIDPYLVN